MMPVNAVVAVIVAILAPIGIANAAEESDPYDPDCGELRFAGQHGPFDYRIISKDDKDLVEKPHFDVEYSAFLKGQNEIPGRGTVAGGFDYTLRAFPNHRLALASMDRLSMRQKTERPRGANFRVECYFQRAVRFVPDDALVRAMYGVYLARRGKTSNAEQQLSLAARLMQQDANVQIQVAAGYFELKRFDLAKVHAQAAYDLGYPLFGLRDRMKSMGKW